MFSGAFEDLSAHKISVSRRAGVISNVKNLREYKKVDKTSVCDGSSSFCCHSERTSERSESKNLIKS